MKISPKEKKILDFVLALAGFGVGLATNTGIIGPTVGLAAGYFVSDLVTEVDTGAIDAATLATQIETIATKVVEAKAASSTSTQKTPA